MLNKGFKEFTKLLNSRNVEYLAVGGYALAAHGHSRYTGDIAIWIGSSERSTSLVMDALRKFGFGDLEISAADLSTPDSVVQLGYPPARIDLLSSIDGVTFAACHANQLNVRIDDVDIPVISERDFRANKLASGRTKDLADMQARDEGKKTTWP